MPSQIRKFRRYFFKNLENIKGKGILYENGKPILEFSLDLYNIGPGEYKYIDIPINKSYIKNASLLLVVITPSNSST